MMAMIARWCGSTIPRSSHQKCSIKKGVFKNFVKFTGIHLCQSLFFNKVAGLKPVTLLKKRPWHRHFALNFAKFFKNTFFTEYLWTIAFAYHKNIHYHHHQLFSQKAHLWCLSVFNWVEQTKNTFKKSSFSDIKVYVCLNVSIALSCGYHPYSSKLGVC